MRTKVNVTAPHVALARLLEALGQELLEASDEEIMEAAKDLGMDPRMRGSAAFAGLTYPARAQLSDFFELGAFRQLPVAAERIANATPAEPKNRARRAKRPSHSKVRKDPAGK
jgi:hypothetical protein